MNNDEIKELYPIKLSDYNIEWPMYFEEEKKWLYNILDFMNPFRIEHIGSTAVPGLRAKSTIDLLVEIPEEFSEIERMKSVLTDHGYIYMQEQTRHIMFVKGYGPTGIEPISYHLHFGPLDQSWLWDRVYFCDYLKKHPETAMEYQVLKEGLAEKYEYDREAYTESKGDFIKRITELAVLKRL